ncbi:hypothetical protein [Allobranchiibius sp. CTAmp26]|uniref:hypothetical protein n=1 Tax=Allobranchiibius sp. CTAmp26 TaxID=2815214 RepID=UPI001AA18A12|nr:hypothetical protein [Allobranchiibius sp. CTAmp26]MBO1755709.1 hypothetical protein [Allobranchiibius sp. CTAmp26]
MSDDATDTDTATQTDEGTQEGQEDAATTFDLPYVQNLRQEAATNRVAAKDATERADALSTRVRELAITVHAGDMLQDSTDLPWSEDLADEGGMPDADKIAAAAEAFIKVKPHLARARGDVQQGFRDDGLANISLVEALRSA